MRLLCTRCAPTSAAVMLRRKSCIPISSGVKGNPDVRFGYSALVDDSGETQVIGRDVQQAARHAQAMGTPGRSAGQAAAPRRTATAVVNEPEGFFDRLAERPGLAAGIAVAVVAVITLVVVGILIMTGARHRR